jgi:hypothetical protein
MRGKTQRPRSPGKDSISQPRSRRQRHLSQRRRRLLSIRTRRVPTSQKRNAHQNGRQTLPRLYLPHMRRFGRQTHPLVFLSDLRRQRRQAPPLLLLPAMLGTGWQTPPLLRMSSLPSFGLITAGRLSGGHVLGGRQVRGGGSRITSAGGVSRPRRRFLPLRHRQRQGDQPLGPPR